MVTETALVLVPQWVEQDLYMQVKVAMMSLPARSQAHRISLQDVGCEAGQIDYQQEGAISGCLLLQIHTLAHPGYGQRVP